MAARFLFLRNEGFPTRWDASRYLKYLGRSQPTLPDDLRDLVSERRLMLSSPESLWHARITDFKASNERIEIAGVSAHGDTPFRFRYADVLKVQASAALYFMPSMVIQELVVLRSGVFRHAMVDLGGNMFAVHCRKMSFLWGDAGQP